MPAEVPVDETADELTTVSPGAPPVPMTMGPSPPDPAESATVIVLEHPMPSASASTAIRPDAALQRTVDALRIDARAARIGCVIRSSFADELRFEGTRVMRITARRSDDPAHEDVVR